MNQAWNKHSVQDVDSWEKLGNPGWNWETLAPYYRKVESCVLSVFMLITVEIGRAHV